LITMATLNSVVFYLLCCELFAVLLMITPMPSAVRGPVIRWISTSTLIGSLAKPVGYSAIVVLAMFGAAISEMMKYRAQHDALKLEGVDLAQKLQVDNQLFRSERNFYLSGACCVLLLVIYRIYQQLKELNKFEGTSYALKKQAEGAKAAYESLTAENTELKAKLKAQKKEATQETSEDSSAATASAAVDDDSELARLREKNKKLATERDAAEKSVEALKKQAEGLSTEYARLTREKESLENKLADFEMLMGDANKKEK